MRTIDKSKVLWYKRAVDEAVKEGNIDEMEDILNLAIEYYPLNKDFLYYKGYLLFLKKRYMDALDEIGIFLQLYEADDNVERLLESIVGGEG